MGLVWMAFSLYGFNRNLGLYRICYIQGLSLDEALPDSPDGPSRCDSGWYRALGLVWNYYDIGGFIMNYRMYCIVSKEALDAMNGNRGKLAAQAGHAFLHAYWDAEERFPEAVKGYRGSEVKEVGGKLTGGVVKITLVVPTTKELETLSYDYYLWCGTSLVRDSGRTVFKEPTVTCLGLGPIREDHIKDDLKALKILI